jgi:serine phosphatase RsbU (regulator of sigma subunit)
VLVGALRTRGDETFDPAAILRTMNDRLLGRAGGHFATCVAAHLGVDRTMRVANAGHIPPYRNGAAMEIPGSLPLGIVAGVEYDVETVRLEAADHLTFVTDGVLEARNEAGELLGFERLASISVLPPMEIARAAIAHGQDDDITVVGVCLRAGTGATVDAAELIGVPA